MVDFNTILSEAIQLSEPDRVRLIEALWELVSDTSSFPLNPDLADEVERRVVEVESGTAQTIPWEIVHQEARDRIRNAQKH